ncbi:CDP-glycerol glycerophosphotransferase [Staphylococcus gallinarum]|uniref:CDP-glycerol glycerophosphotransferase n=1 Tax=Staphylococcus gallinarum TaxID=1293 RepID=A0A3A0VZ54_STAGA|nr:CDP-glycerol glycerophosphotransferase family protein [Staphylococcus gallinarum]RIP33974.1 CDP-glycerol glycerophosphotransferase [Staphylococcus gallinarum]
MQDFDRVFLIEDEVAYRVKFNANYEFNLYHYHIQINDNQFFVYHKILNVSNIIINEAPNKTGYIVKIDKANAESISKFENLILMDNENYTIETYPVKVFGDQLTAKIPFATLTENASKKKLYIEGIEVDGETERSVIYSIREQYVDRVIYQSNISINNQYYIMDFYSNKGIELLYRKPFFKNGINYIKNDKINFFVKADDLYSHCTFTLTFEDRYTNDYIEYQINVGETELQLDYEAIDHIISKTKTVVDLFVNVKEDDTIVRKEKIRYRTVKYKKDVFFSQYVFDTTDERVFYLSTITPFKNIKLERFAITKDQMKVMDSSEKDNNVWLISERFDTAQDNGIVFFKWLQQHTNVDAYYVIDTESADYPKIKDYNNVLEFGSLKHFEIANKAKVLISTHDLENVLPYKPAKGFYGYEDTLKVFLQHGVLGRKNVEYHKTFYDLPFDMFNVSSESEKQDVVVNQMEYDPQNVYVTGLSRFDDLPLNDNNQQVKKVLIMPTWRDWLNSDIAFENSEYLQRYLNLTKNRELNQLIDSKNIEVNFYPHYRAQHYFKLFLTNNHIKVKYVELGERTVQSLLIEHDLLITDYSSVSFDFTYMNKPVIFYHFDVKRFFRKGILRPIHETFLGDIVNDEKSLVNLIKEYVESTNDIKPVNKQSIFTNIDQNNNLRIYENISKRLNSES